MLFHHRRRNRTGFALIAALFALGALAGAALAGPGEGASPTRPPASRAVRANERAFPVTGFRSAQAPAMPAATDGKPIEVGVKFRADVPGYVTAVRYWKAAANGGPHVARLWTADGRRLIEAKFLRETSSGWQTVRLPQAVRIAPNTTYVASVSSNGYYPVTREFFGRAVTNGPLRLLADGEDGPQGVFEYGAGTLPGSSFKGANYWVDVVFDTTSGPDVTPPTIVSTTPGSGAGGVAVAPSITLHFSESLAAATLDAASVRLDGPGGDIACAILYDSTAQSVTLTPAAPLAFATPYTVRVRGGATAPHVTDAAGNALATDYTLSFTTTVATPAGPNDGPGGPVLVVSSTTNPFSRYAVEILRAEGLNLFAAADLSTVDASLLTGYDVVVLGQVSLSNAQVTMFANWVNAGGTLIAFRPDKDLASLLGLATTNQSVANQYLQVVTTAGSPGAGITPEVMQFHGGADLYTLSGATAVAWFTTAAGTPTANPAVTTRDVGTNGGRAIAFTYDLARSVVYTRQGNPAWANQDRDGRPPMRSNDLFYGASASDPQPDWVDFSKIAIPQADEQQRLFANLLTAGAVHRKPLPRFWYFPNGRKAVVVMTGDDHGDAGMKPRFDIYRQESPAACDNDAWSCVRATGYLYLGGTTFTSAQADFYHSLGFEIAPHIYTGCSDYTPAMFDTALTNQINRFHAQFPNLPLPVTNRTHCIAWSGWSAAAESEAAHGIRLDTNYYYWPDAWVQNRPGLFTGSGMPMRFAKTDGSLIDCYQVATQMTDESAQAYPLHCDSLLERALGPRGYYGAFCANMHFDNPNHAGSNAIVGSALSRGVSVISSRQLLTWLDGRNNSSFAALAWAGNTLTFTISVASGSDGLQAMLPANAASGPLTALTRNGQPVPFTVQLVKGVQYVTFQADPGDYVAAYVPDTTPPALGGVTATPNADGSATVTWTTDEPATSQVDYGTTQSLGTTVVDSTKATSHSVRLTGLAATTTYWCRATSADGSGNAATVPAPVDAPLSFTTPANTPPAAAAAASPASGMAPLYVTLSGAASTDADGDSLSYAWTFGDGGTATGRLANHAYATAGSYQAVLTVTDGRGGSATTSLTITVTPAAFPVTNVLDTFNRTNGAIGANWLDQTTFFSVAQNLLAPQTGDHYVEWGSAFGPDQEVFVTLSAIAGSAPEHNLMLKTQGSSWSAGHIEVCYRAGAGRVDVITMTPPATWTTAASLPGVTFAPGDQFGARATSAGGLIVFRNGTAVGSVSVASWPYAAMGGRIGLSVSNASTARFDNFGGGSIPGGVLAAGDPGGPTAPGELALSSAYPNPAHDSVTLSLALPHDADVAMQVYDVLGRTVWTEPARRFTPGRYTIRWDGKGTDGPAVAGVYLVRLGVGAKQFTRRVALVR